ncbi:MAG: DNA repair protein radA [Synergistales bacterium 53_16]|nr:MAG: DNA repair protein radA [Synergistales bacterium 53_16]KUL05137.1 MAG: DNA repair protein radA [Synergistales bacterium 54_9]
MWFLIFKNCSTPGGDACYNVLERWKQVNRTLREDKKAGLRMPRVKGQKYQCLECGFIASAWSGKCPSCGSWGSLEVVNDEIGKDKGWTDIISAPVAVDGVKAPERLPSGLNELDRVLGGGWVESSVVLIAGEPGIGKSTLLLQACGRMAAAGNKVLYISGEESLSQVALRARRLGAVSGNLMIAAGNAVDDLLSGEAAESDLVVLDSVQALSAKDLPGYPGTPSQVRAVALRAVDLAKGGNVPVVLVGHINKEGLIAGPKLLEHMVDAVLVFSGENISAYRMLRAVKNRFGATDEVGIFEMKEKGLFPVADPSRLYWSGIDQAIPGVAMTVTLEGSRPFVAEVQALTSSTPYPYPRRTGRGFENGRLDLMLAVLERRCGLGMASMDVYVNVAGGLSIKGPHADLALCLSVASAVKDKPLLQDCCCIGEIGLAGEVRPVPRTSLRVREAKRLGFRHVLLSGKEEEEFPEGMEVHAVSTLAEALKVMGI